MTVLLGSTTAATLIASLTASSKLQLRAGCFRRGLVGPREHTYRPPQPAHGMKERPNHYHVNDMRVVLELISS